MKRLSFSIMVLLLLSVTVFARANEFSARHDVATFSIVGYDPATGELGVAVASRFFTVGNVVPWAKAGVGAVATQAYANTSFGWRGLDMLATGMTVEQVRDSLLTSDDDPTRRQFGIVDATGEAVTYTGEGCADWAGGRSGTNYACQGNILAGEAVVVEMEKAFLNTEGTLADRLYAALLAGEAAGGDSRGKQSAALLVVKEGAGYGGYTDRAIDVRVDDHKEPFKELGRILNIAQMNYNWNVAWTLFTKKKYDEALEPMERTARLAPDNDGVLYDLAVIRLHSGKKQEAYEALAQAIELNPKLKVQAVNDNDLNEIHGEDQFLKLVN